jgi:hypothetical protein
MIHYGMSFDKCTSLTRTRKISQLKMLMDIMHCLPSWYAWCSAMVYVLISALVSRESVRYHNYRCWWTSRFVLLFVCFCYDVVGDHALHSVLDMHDAVWWCAFWRCTCLSVFFFIVLMLTWSKIASFFFLNAARMLSKSSWRLAPTIASSTCPRVNAKSSKAHKCMASTMATQTNKKCYVVSYKAITRTPSSPVE